MRARWLTPFLLLGLAIDGFAAQDWVGTGSNLSSCQKLYEGLDPQLGLKWHPEIMPPTSLGRCVGDKDWKLLGQEGGSCCFLAPSTQGPEPAFLVPIDKISTNGGRCGQHPWAPTFAICTEPPGPQQRPQATGNRPNNPCWIDDSLPPKQRVELYQRCVGQTPTPIEGARGIERRPDQSLKPTKVSPPNDAAAMIDAMDRCLRAQPLIYYHSPNKRTYSGVAASDHSTILYNPAYLNRQPPYLRAYMLADAFASYVLDRRGEIYPEANEAPGYRRQATDYMVGYLAHCLRSEENLLQQDSKDPRTWFSDYRRFQGKSDLPASGIKERLDDFNTGWGQLGYPLGNNIYIKEAPPEFEIVQ